MCVKEGGCAGAACATSPQLTSAPRACDSTSGLHLQVLFVCRRVQQGPLLSLIEHASRILLVCSSVIMVMDILVLKSRFMQIKYHSTRPQSSVHLYTTCFYVYDRYVVSTIMFMVELCRNCSRIFILLYSPSSHIVYEKHKNLTGPFPDKTSKYLHKSRFRLLLAILVHKNSRVSF